VFDQLLQLFDKALTKVTEKNLLAHTVTVKIKYHDFVQITRSRTLPQPISAAIPLKALLLELLKNTDIGKRNVRLLGITLSSLDNTEVGFKVKQIDLFENGWQ
jgi:DNA polymerase IV